MQTDWARATSSSRRTRRGPCAASGPCVMRVPRLCGGYPSSALLGSTDCLHVDVQDMRYKSVIFWGGEPELTRLVDCGRARCHKRCRQHPPRGGYEGCAVSRCETAPQTRSCAAKWSLACKDARAPSHSPGGAWVPCMLGVLFFFCFTLVTGVPRS